MAKITIKPGYHTDGFVGMRFESKNSKEGIVSAGFPHGFQFSEGGGDQTALKKELFSLLRTVKRHSRNPEQDLHGSRSQAQDFPFDAYITIIKAFMQYGYYIESEVRYKNAPAGKISWKRTIGAVRPLVQNGSPVYTDFIVRQNEKKADRLISLIHEWCVHEAFAKLGWLFTAFSPRRPALKIADNRGYFISVIRESLKATFNDRNKQLFNAMIAMLKYERAEDGSPFFFGTTHFHTVWESLIDVSYGIPESDKRKFFPPAKWRFIEKFGRSHEKDAGCLQPDTIMICDTENIFVLDAKYYAFVNNKKNLPGVSDINKQIAYGKYAASKHTGKTYNAFLIPYNFEADPHKLGTKGIAEDKYFYIGFAFLDYPPTEDAGDAEHDRVLGILADTKWLIDNAGSVNRKELAEFIKSRYADHFQNNNAECRMQK